MSTLVELFLGTGVYFYAITILTQYGYNSYFGIPYDFIDFSIKNNIIFFFDLLRIAQGVAANLNIWAWLGLGLLVLVIWILKITQILNGLITTTLIIIITVFSLFGFYNFGGKIAQIQKEFRTIPSECISEEKNILYIIPTFYQTTAIITPINSDTNRLTGGLLIKKSDELNCEIRIQKIEQIIKNK